MKERTSKAMSFKAIIRNIAKEKNVAPQIVMQNFMMERFLNRIAVSEYKESFIVKGGSLVSALVGLANRTTMDIDVTITGFTLEEKELEKVIANICNIELDDDTIFELRRCENIRDDDLYGGTRVFMSGYFDNKTIEVPFCIDVSTGDIVTPKPQKRKWNCLLDEGNHFELLSYPIETILAEKVETILSRGVLSTRPRDFYDVYILTKTYHYNKETLNKALEETSKHRGSVDRIANSRINISVIEKSSELKEFWNRYARSNSFSKNLSYEEVVDAVKKILE